jgi:hypothetical protein
MQKIIVTICMFPFLVGCAPKFLSSLGSSQQQQLWDSISSNKELNISLNSSNNFNSISYKYNYEGKSVNDLFIETIAQKLDEKKIFNKIHIISGIENPKTDYLLEINLEFYNKSGWFRRAFENRKSELGIYGRLINLRKDKAILTYSKVRIGSGAICPGFFTIGGDLALSGGFVAALYYPSVSGSSIVYPAAYFLGSKMLIVGVGMELVQIILSPFTPNEKALIKKFIEWSAEDIVTMIETNLNK